MLEDDRNTELAVEDAAVDTEQHEGHGSHHDHAGDPADDGQDIMTDESFDADSLHCCAAPATVLDNEPDAASGHDPALIIDDMDDAHDHDHGGTADEAGTGEDADISPDGHAVPGIPMDQADDSEQEDDDEAETTQPASQADTTCFVATAAFRDHAHEDVAYLRQFRNTVLRRSLAGRVFIAVYWQIGPLLAVPVRRSDRLAALSRLAIGAIVRTIKALR